MSRFTMRIRRHATALLTMGTGSAVVFGTVLFMNERVGPPAEQSQSSAVAFNVERKPPPKKRKRRARRAKRQKRSSRPVPGAPDLSSGLSGMAMNFSGIQTAGFGEVSSDLLGEVDKKGPMTAGALDTPPRVRSRGGRLEYPNKARKEGIEGYVLLNLYIRADGSVGTVKLLDAAPRGMGFEDAAKDSVRDWAFDPGSYQGEAVDTWAKQKITFSLQKS